MKFALSSSILLAACFWTGLAAAQGGGVWAVGDGGTILHSAGVGQPWVQQTSGTTQNLHDIFFQDASRGWVVGDNGTVLSTDNGGATWSPHSTPAMDSLREICFSDSQNGWLSGMSARVYRTADGGATWTQLPTSTFYNNGSAGSSTGSHFFDGQRGWMAFFGMPLYETIDGGATWNARSSAQMITDASFVDQDHLWAGGVSGLLMNTSDGGNTWQTQIRGSGTIFGVDFVNPTCGWVAGDPWYALSHTTDGGQTWTSQATGMSYGTTAVTFADENHGWVFSAMGEIRYTSDGGASFTAQASPATRYINEAVWVVPEPSTLVLLGVGVFGLLAWGWRRKRN
jgi:photosystem II stability/assembly factor-like uncharacterized protein